MVYKKVKMVYNWLNLQKLVDNAFPDIDLCSFLEQLWWGCVVHLAYQLIWTIWKHCKWFLNQPPWLHGQC